MPSARPIRTTKLVSLADIQPHPENYNHGDPDAIGDSLDRHGQFRAIVVSEVTGNILAGSHTFIAAKQSGDLKMLAHLLPNLTPEEEISIMVADNRIADLAHTDDHILAGHLQTLSESESGLVGTGWDADNYDGLMSDLWPSQTFEQDDDGKYTRKVESPVYEPTGERPPIASLTDSTPTDNLRADIEAADLTDDETAFLVAAANRHTVFRYDEIANYYAHAPANIQRLMEASALVIIDFDAAIERGFVQLNETTAALFKSEYPDA